MGPVTISAPKRYTYADYLKLNDALRHELIRGQLIMVPAPSTRHQRISGRLFYALQGLICALDLGELFAAPCDMYLDDENVMQPDLLFVSKARLGIVEDKYICGSPDLVIEIISESSAYRDMVEKKRLYARFGISEY